MSTANFIIFGNVLNEACNLRSTHGVLPESTDSLKTSYLSRENTYRLVIVDFEVGEVRYALICRYKNKSERNCPRNLRRRSALFDAPPTGWVPSYLRLGPHFIISLPLFEQVRAALGLGYL